MTMTDGSVHPPFQLLQSIASLPACAQIGILNLVCFAVVCVSSWLSGMTPRSCRSALGCEEELPEPEDVPFLRESVLGCAVLFVVEVCSLLVRWLHEPAARRASILTDASSGWPTSIMCGEYFILVSCQLTYFLGLDVRHARPPMTGGIHWRPILTTRMIQWTFSMPLMHTLLGCYAFHRPATEVWPAILATDSYIMTAWQALLLPHGALRVVVVIFAFAAYFFSVWDMWKWSVATRETLMPVRHLRMGLLWTHIILYGLYGVVYLLALNDHISFWSEYMCYFVMDMIVKGSTATVGSMIHKAEMYHDGISMVAKTMEANSLMSSLLRASCDAALSCEITCTGRCVISPIASSETTEQLASLENLLGYSLHGADVEEMIDGAHLCSQFRAYVQNVWHQAQSMASKAAESHHRQASHRAPLAQMLHSRLIVGGSGSNSGSESSLDVTIMISVPVQHSVGPLGYDKIDALLGLQVIDNSAQGPLGRGGEFHVEDDAFESASQIRAPPVAGELRSVPVIAKVRHLAQQLVIELLNILQPSQLGKQVLTPTEQFSLGVRRSMQLIVSSFCCLLRMESGEGMEAAVDSLCTGTLDGVSRRSQMAQVDHDPLAAAAADLISLLQQSLQDQGLDQQQQSLPLSSLQPGLSFRPGWVKQSQPAASSAGWKKDM